MNKIKYLRLLPSIAVVTLLLAGCATLEQPLRENLVTQTPAVRQCAEAFHALDAAVDRAGVRDAEAHRIAGFPYLRVDRYHAQLRDDAARDAQAQAFWVSRLQALDGEARRVEISNLAEAEILALESNGRAALLDNTAHCADILRELDMTSPQRVALLHARAQVPDRYVTWQRAAGLYGLTRIPFSMGIAQWQRDTWQDFRAVEQGRAPAQPLLRYAMPDAAVVTREQLAAMIRRASANPLRVPQFGDAERAALVSAFAPVFEIETGAAYDRIGRLQWSAAGALTVNHAEPVVYYRVAFARHRDFGDQPLTQIVYTVWFAERPRNHALDLLAGHLDGVMFRVTLSPDGEPLLYDSIHPCGCYHLFFPTARVQPVPAPDGEVEWAFVPATLPAHNAGARISVRIATRSHYLLKVALDAFDGPGAAESYTLLPEAELRSLPRGNERRSASNERRSASNERRSAYGQDGIISGTQRGERVFFWPMGIPSAGAMRQWGHHATAFVGRRHFDDADLIDKRFRLIAP
jgi:hypothetical protein